MTESPKTEEKLGRILWRKMKLEWRKTDGDRVFRKLEEPEGLVPRDGEAIDGFLSGRRNHSSGLGKTGKMQGYFQGNQKTNRGLPHGRARSKK